MEKRTQRSYGIETRWRNFAQNHLTITILRNGKHYIRKATLQLSLSSNFFQWLSFNKRVSSFPTIDRKLDIFQCSLEWTLIANSRNNNNWPLSLTINYFRAERMHNQSNKAELYKGIFLYTVPKEKMITYGLVEKNLPQ